MQWLGSDNLLKIKTEFSLETSDDTQLISKS